MTTNMKRFISLAVSLMLILGITTVAPPSVSATEIDDGILSLLSRFG